MSKRKKGTSDPKAIARHEEAVKICPCPFHLTTAERDELLQKGRGTVCLCVPDCPAQDEYWEG